MKHYYNMATALSHHKSLSNKPLNSKHPVYIAELGNEGVSTHTHHPGGGVHGKYAKAIGLLKILQKYDLCVDGNAFLPQGRGTDSIFKPPCVGCRFLNKKKIILFFFSASFLKLNSDWFCFV